MSNLFGLSSIPVSLLVYMQLAVIFYCGIAIHTSMSFKAYLEYVEKPWVAKKDDVLTFWQHLQPNMPLNIQPIPPQHKGRRYDVDGIRINGSRQFIASVLSRLKDLLQFENRPGTKLDIEYRQAKKKPGISEPKFTCYIYAVQEEPSGGPANAVKPPIATEL